MLSGHCSVAVAQATLYAKSIVVGSTAVNANAVVFDGHNVWVAVEGAGSGYVLKLTSSGSILSYTSVGVAPLEMAYDGSKIWVTDYTSSDITVVAGNGTLVKTINLPANADPEGILFDGLYIWVANNGVGSSYSNTVSKYDPATMRLIANYQVGLSPDGIAFDGTYIWVTNSYNNNVVKLNRQTGQILRTYPTGTFPLSIIFDGVNVWIANGADVSVGSYVTGTVTKLRAYGGVNLGTFAVGNTVRGLGYDGTAIWACNSTDNTFSRLAASNGARLGTYHAGTRPRSMAFDGTYMWIANSGDNTLSVVTSRPIPSDSALVALPPVNSAIDAAFSATTNKSPPTPAVVGAILGNTLLGDN